ncbi:MAG: phosphoribosylglycinamide formyltransferase [Gloeomargaritaceae cyanobacterium C42_A2020_066]|nr:phosphoribosylglycinamide formyltransferase [Gloeomargaritaceae cyanobacterium C42_A2020_066]
MNCVCSEALISPALDWPAVRDLPLRLGILASGNGSNFAAIAQAIDQGQLCAQIQGVIYNNPQARVAQRAAERGLPSVLINHRDFGGRETFDATVAATLRGWDVDWVIMAGWMRCATPVLLDAFPGHILNIHPSLLPSFPGLHAVEQALRAGVTITGCTVHIVTLAVDQGPIIAQAAVPIFGGDTPDTLARRIHTQEHQLYPWAIALAAGRA